MTSAAEQEPEEQKSPVASARELPVIARTLAIGAAGGIAAELGGLPAGLLSGSMAAVAIAAVCGVQVLTPIPVRQIAFIVLGAVLGSTTDQNTLAAMQKWPLSMAALIASFVIMMIVVPRYLTRFHGFDPDTAKLSATPGTLSLVIALAVDTRADARRVALLQSLRLVALMILFPLVAGLAGLSSSSVPEDAPLLPLWELAVLFLVCGVGVLLLRRLRMPAPEFLGSMVASGALFSTGTLHGQIPGPMVWPALIATGAVVGAMFQGTDRRLLFSSAKASLGAITLACLISAAFAVPVADYLGLPVMQVWLGFAPGGLDSMTVLAFSLGYDPAFVAGHQLVRFLSLSLALPFLFSRKKAKN